MSLADFAQRVANGGSQYKPGRPCSVCSLPAELAAEVTEALKSGEWSQQMIVDYLVTDHGIDMTLPKLQGHVRNGHVPGYEKRRR